MQVDFTPEQELFVQQAIRSGRFSRPEEAAEEAFSLWLENERKRVEVLKAVGEAKNSIARGEGRLVTSETQIDDLVEATRRRGMARIAWK